MRKSLFTLIILGLMGLLMACSGNTATPTEIPTAQSDDDTSSGIGGDVSPTIVVMDAWMRPVIVVSNEAENTDDTATDDEAPLGNPARGERPSQATMNPGAVTALYMTIENRSPTDDTLIGVIVAPDVASAAMIHQTIVENDVARMQETPLLTIPANDRVVLESGGYHVMVMGVQRDLLIGESVQVTLVFQSGRTLDVTATVQESSS